LKSVFPPGPIGFQVQGIGFEYGNPMVNALVALGSIPNVTYQQCHFKRILGEWHLESQRLDGEEKEMLNKIWTTETIKNGFNEYDAWYDSLEDGD
jgi:hypothetical protein